MKSYLEKTSQKNKQEYFSYIEGRLKQNQKTFVVTANPEILMLGEKDKVFDQLLMDNSTEIIADGIGVVKGAKLFNIPIPERITGVELAEQLIRYCDTYQKRLYLFGAQQEVLDEMKNKIAHKYPNVKLVGCQNGYIQEKQKEFQKIAKLSPDVVLVALGTPRQEKLIYENLSFFEKGIFVGVGGSFDVLSGIKKRAPKLFIKLNLEWLYRIAKEPKRWKRFYNGNIKYIFKLKKELRKNK